MSYSHQSSARSCPALLVRLFSCVGLIAPLAHADIAIIHASIPGGASPWLAGAPDGVPGCNCGPGHDSAPDNAPILIDVAQLAAGDLLTFDVSGFTCHGPVTELCGMDADGIQTSAPCLNCGSLNGLANACAPRTALMGVFLSSVDPSNSPAPPILSYTTDASRNFSIFEPLLKQVFFIGNGRRDDDTAQQFVVPEGATRLYLGVMDNCGWWNNEGTFDVVITASTIRTVHGGASPWLAGAPDGVSGCNCGTGHDSAPDNAPILIDVAQLAAGDLLTFDVSGFTCHGPVTELCGMDADGIQTSAPCLNCGSLNGLANACAPLTALMGVFLSSVDPGNSPAPPILSYTTDASRNFTIFEPLLKQVFFIGNGRRDDDTAQQFVVPEGATRLYLGVMDSCGWWNNEGHLLVRATPLRSCRADINDDGVVNGADISVLLGYWGQSGKNVVGDINGDWVVNGADLAQLLGSWGSCK